MTFMLTAVAVGGTTLPKGVPGELLLEAVTPRVGMAGYLPGLARHLGHPIDGSAFYVVAEEAGYRSSNILFPYPDADEEPVCLAVPSGLRQRFDAILRDLLLLSPDGTVILVSEYNGGVTDPTSEATEVEVLGPWSRAEFWRQHDLGEVLEESIVVLREPRGGQSIP